MAGKVAEEIAPGFVLDFDAAGNVLGIDLDSEASKKVDLSRLETEGLQISLELARPQGQQRSKAV